MSDKTDHIAEIRSVRPSWQSDGLFPSAPPLTQAARQFERHPPVPPRSLPGQRQVLQQNRRF